MIIAQFATALDEWLSAFNKKGLTRAAQALITSNPTDEPSENVRDFN